MARIRLSQNDLAFNRHCEERLTSPPRPHHLPQSGNPQCGLQSSILDDMLRDFLLIARNAATCKLQIIARATEWLCTRPCRNRLFCLHARRQPNLTVPATRGQNTGCLGLCNPGKRCSTSWLSWYKETSSTMTLASGWLCVWRERVDHGCRA